MQYNPEIHHRRSIRLKSYDYSQNGAYYITICVQNRFCLFGNIVDEQMKLNDVGRMIEYQWNELTNRFNNIHLDAHIVMPNHFHGIIIVGAPLVGALFEPLTTFERAPTRGAPTIGHIIGAFKSITTHTYIAGIKNFNWPSYDNKIWQRNYYEHTIRNEESLEKIREYITNNPKTWKKDKLFFQDLLTLNR